jgi:hypothetical protein
VARGRAIALCIVAVASGCSLTSGAQADPGCGGLLQPPCPPPPPPQNPPPDQPSQPPPPGEARVTLHASRLYSTWGEQVTFSGKVTGAPAGSATRIVLRSWATAYKRQFVDMPGETDAAGRFRIYARPQVNSTFRVVVERGQRVTGRSNRVGVRVYPSLTVDFGHDDYGNPDSIFVTADGPSQLYTPTGPVRLRRGSARAAYFYGIPRHSKRAYKLGRGRLKRTDCEDTTYCQLLAKWRLRPSRRLRKARRVLACLHGRAFLGMGSGYAACGRKVIRLR